MTELFYEKYDGEMFFDITDLETSNSGYSFVIKSQYNDKVIGVKVTLPVLVQRALFKTVKLVRTNQPLMFESIGEESDNFICVLEELLKPPYKSTKYFSELAEGVDFSVLNREVYNLDTDKLHLKLYNKEDQSDFEEDERINLEMNFSFNFATKRASLAEVREGYSADLIAILMR